MGASAGAGGERVERKGRRGEFAREGTPGILGCGRAMTVGPEPGGDDAEMGPAMLTVARFGYGSRILEPKDTQAVVRSGWRVGFFHGGRVVLPDQAPAGNSVSERRPERQARQMLEAASCYPTLPRKACARRGTRHLYWFEGWAAISGPKRGNWVTRVLWWIEYSRTWATCRFPL